VYLIVNKRISHNTDLVNSYQNYASSVYMIHWSMY